MAGPPAARTWPVPARGWYSLRRLPPHVLSRIEESLSITVTKARRAEQRQDRKAVQKPFAAKIKPSGDDRRRSTTRD